MASQPFAGVLVPVLTPFTPSGEPDAGRFIASLGSSSLMRVFCPARSVRPRRRPKT